MQAVTADGRVAWTAAIAPGINKIPDFQGGLVLQDDFTVTKLDGLTGQPHPTYTIPDPINTKIGSTVVHTDGTIFVVAGDSVIGLDPSAGGQKFSVQMEHSKQTSNGAALPDSPPQTGKRIVAGDGNAYVAYEYSVGANFSSGGPPWFLTSHTDSYLKVLRVGTDGSSTETLVKSWSVDFARQLLDGPQRGPGNGNVESVAPAGSGVRRSAATLASASALLNSNSLDGLITNADQGVLFSFLDPSVQGVPPTQTVATVSTGGGVQLSTMR